MNTQDRHNINVTIIVVIVVGFALGVGPILLKAVRYSLEGLSIAPVFALKEATNVVLYIAVIVAILLLIRWLYSVPRAGRR